MLDTLFSKTKPFLMTRFLSKTLKHYSVIGDNGVMYRDLVKATYNEFDFHCLGEKAEGKILNILSAEIYIRDKYELHQYVIWYYPPGNIYAATLLNGDEDFKIKK